MVDGIRFINLMGGHIWIESEGPDKGTTVTFIAKFGICNNPHETRLQVAPAVRPHQGSAGFIGHKPFVVDLPRYQNSY